MMIFFLKMLDTALCQMEPDVGIQVKTRGHLHQQLKGNVWPLCMQQRQAYIIHNLNTMKIFINELVGKGNQ